MRSVDVVDGQRVNIPVLYFIQLRRTKKVRSAKDWLFWFKSLGVEKYKTKCILS